MFKRMLLVAVAVVMALLGTFAVYSYAHNADKRAVASTRAATALVATKRIPAGTTWADAVKGSYFSAERMPADSVPSSAIPDLTAAAIGGDAVAQADIASGSIVLREAFGTETAQTGVLAIPKGKIAVTVSLASDADVAGYVGVNSQVIIFLTARLKTKTRIVDSTGDDIYTTRTLIGRASVIAVSQAAPTTVAGAKAGDASSLTGSVLVTLALGQRDAERIVVSQKTGELYLGLLSASSAVDANDPGVLNAGVFAPAPVFVK